MSDRREIAPLDLVLYTLIIVVGCMLVAQGVVPLGRWIGLATWQVLLAAGALGGVWGHLAGRFILPLLSRPAGDDE